MTDRVSFEKKVIVDGHSKKIDVYIPETHTLIEQKSLGIALDKKITNSGDIDLTPYEQAKRYNDNLPYEERARWIVTCNFAEIWIYDMNTAVPTPVKVDLSELQSKFFLFDFMVNKEQKTISHEVEVSVKAGEFVGLIYDALKKEYKDPESKDSQRSLNILCVRLVFCLYAEDAHIFGNSGHEFHDYMASYDTKNMRRALIDLFKVLDQDPEKNERDPYLDEMLARFPYVNGGLFKEDNIEIPQFTDEIRNILLTEASEGFDWSTISPTIFGAVFESTLNADTRRSGGMHYTSIENIHKVIDPLFLDDLQSRYDAIFYDNADAASYTEEEKKELKKLAEEEKDARIHGDSTRIRDVEKRTQAIKSRRTRRSNLNIKQQYDALVRLQDDLSKLTFLDPACGSGNFLTESYLSLRRLENHILEQKIGIQTQEGQLELLATANPIKVQISQFYGIEINDFAVTVAKTALWIAESQMMKETEDILLSHLDFLPLKTNAYIVEGNALRIDWKDVVSNNKLNYIMGNPPFNGTRTMSKAQKDDVLTVFGKQWKALNSMDYVACWYKKAADFIRGTSICCGFVSTNSIVQGEQVPALWKPLFEKYDIEIQYAYQTFVWDSEAKSQAHVHCVIIGFSTVHVNHDKILFMGNSKRTTSNINAYLNNAPNVFIERQNTPICDVPEMFLGCTFNDNNNLIMEYDEKELFLSKYPYMEKYIKPYIMGKDFIDRKPRYCFWLKNADPSEIKKCDELIDRIERVRAFRKTCKNDNTFDSADTPMLPSIFRYYNKDVYKPFIAIPKVSSQRRRYIPMELMPGDYIAGDKIFLMPDADLYSFGILTSNVHMAWMRTFCGRLKSDYSYSSTIIYNTLPWPNPTKEQKAKIENSAQAILDARSLYLNSSLADLYDPITMPLELQKAHQENNKAVMQAYGFYGKNMSEADCVAALMKMYQNLTKQ